MEDGTGVAVAEVIVGVAAVIVGVVAVIVAAVIVAAVIVAVVIGEALAMEEEVVAEGATLAATDGAAGVSVAVAILVAMVAAAAVVAMVAAGTGGGVAVVEEETVVEAVTAGAMMQKWRHSLSPLGTKQALTLTDMRRSPSVSIPSLFIVSTSETDLRGSFRLYWIFSSVN